MESSVRGKVFAIIVALALIPAAAFTEEKGPAQSSDLALKKLREGNVRFISGHRSYPNLGRKRLALLSKGQYPYATVLACSDSRVPVEHIFDAGIGDIFVIRVAGNVSGIDEIATIEYGAEHLHTPVLVVMGHSSCGAVTAATRGDSVGGNIPELLKRIAPAVDKAKKKYGDAFSAALLDGAIRMNVWQAIEDLMKKSPIIAELVKEKKLKIVGALYHIDSGKIDWMGEHPEQAAMLHSENKPD